MGPVPGKLGVFQWIMRSRDPVSNPVPRTDGYGSSEKNFHLASELHDLQEEFDEAIRITKKSFKSNDLPEIIDYLQTHVKSLLGPNRKQQATAQAVREEFECIKTISKLFSVLQDKYISWFNYKLMIKLVGVFLPKNRSLKRTWSAYEEKLEDYFINSGGLLKDADAVQFGVKGVPPGTRVMIAKVDRNDYTLDDLFFFRRSIPKALDVPEYDLYFCFVRIGSLCLGYLIPEYLYSLLFPLTTKLQQQLASIGITELTCVLNRTDICDPLWYENTSTPLHEAAWRGLKDEVQWLLNKFGYSTYHRGLHGWTPLHSASYGGHIKILRLLIHQYGIDPNEDTCHVPPDQPDNSNNTALLYSAMGGHSDLVEFFIENNCNTSHINCEGASLSLLACQSGEFELVYKLESLNHFSPNSFDFYQSGILHYSSMSNNVELFKYLLNQYQLSIDVKDRFGRTPLHIASWFASSSVVEYIVSIQELNCFLSFSRKLALALTLTSMLLQMMYNLNANDTDTYGRTPLVYSCWSGSINSVKYLINDHNSDSNIIENDSMTCLHRSCRHGHIDITQYLIEAQYCDINKTDNYRRTLVHQTAWSGNFDLVQYLITEQGLSPMAVDKDGVTALHYASLSLNLFLVKELITTHQLDPHQADSKDSMLPLHYAAQSGDILLLELYVKDYKCSLSLTDNRGWNIFHVTSLKGHAHFIKHITSHYPQYISLLHSTDKLGHVLLHIACESGNIQLVTFLINDMKCDVNATATIGSNCVMNACFSGNLDLVQLLIQKYKLEPININNNGFSVLHAAVQVGHTHILEWYSQEYSVDITNHTNNKKYTLAHIAAYCGKLHCLQQLINKYQCDVNATTTDTGSTVLHRACQGSHLPVVLYLTSLPQCNVAAKTFYGSTALHITCEYSGSLPILKHLVENHQLDLFAVNIMGKPPIHLACSDGRLNLIKYIIERAPSSLELNDASGQTPFLIAVHYNQLEIIKYLISKNCNLSATNSIGSGAIHLSVALGHLNVLKYLIDNNYCNPNATNFQDRTPLHFVVMLFNICSLYEVLEYLLSKSIPSMSVVRLREIKCLLDSPHDIYNNPHNAVLINVQDKDGNTPLHVACQRGPEKILAVSLLLKASLSNNNLLITNKKGHTSLHLAVASGHKDTAKALLSSVIGSFTHHDLLTATDNEGYTVLHTACSNGHNDVFYDLFSIYPQGVN
uniref:Uncharacterized protein n=1 Tax=Amphimedon queenslandica TaxID=400682 RepID=A0A1X7TE00_AMPQE